MRQTCGRLPQVFCEESKKYQANRKQKASTECLNIPTGGGPEISPGLDSTQVYGLNTNKGQNLENSVIWGETL